MQPPFLILWMPTEIDWLLDATRKTRRYVSEFNTAAR